MEDINLKLIDLIDEIKESNNEKVKNEFLYYLVNAKLVVPVVVDTVPDEEGNVDENTNVRYFSIKNTEGKIYLVTFTNTDYFEKWQPDIMKYHVRYDFNQLKAMVTRAGSGFAGFVIDPNFGNMAVPNEILRSIQRVSSDDMEIKAEKIVTEGNVGLTPAENPPEKLMTALKEFMANDRSILEAYMMQTIRKGETTPTYIIVVDFLGSAKRVFDSLAEVAQNNLDVPQAIGVMPASDKIARKYIENVEPFYKK
ncbi:MAG: enhanced serine sensitivity protein SseB C-terminal domain-containing protein [Lachnospirales bacterium]